ncbi:hypothetical protein RB195_020071 [Necator americanus]|uniref:Phlebovirus glycoprotein G2 fusion domain-containing protein n=1 Tax=Necator americanus TaxID=51031 RepID=A0ABR1CH48_NECAM
MSSSAECQHFPAIKMLDICYCLVAVGDSCMCDCSRTFVTWRSGSGNVMQLIFHPLIEPQLVVSYTNSVHLLDTSRLWVTFKSNSTSPEALLELKSSRATDAFDY